MYRAFLICPNLITAMQLLRYLHGGQQRLLDDFVVKERGCKLPQPLARLAHVAAARVLLLAPITYSNLYLSPALCRRAPYPRIRACPELLQHNEFANISISMSLVAKNRLSFSEGSTFYPYFSIHGVKLLQLSYTYFQFEPLTHRFLQIVVTFLSYSLQKVVVWLQHALHQFLVSMRLRMLLLTCAPLLYSSQCTATTRE